MLRRLWRAGRKARSRTWHWIAWPWRRVAGHFERGKLLRVPEGVRVCVFSGEDVSDHLLRGSFEPAIRKFLQDVLRPGMVFIDAGANLGLYTAIASSLVGPSGAVFAFEPSRREWSRARRTMAANDAKNAGVYRIALTDHDGEVLLNVCEPKYGAFNSLGVVTHFYAAGHESHVERVMGRSLDSFVAEKHLARVDVVKIDVEGAEELVLRGGRKLFSGPEAPVLICELSDWTAEGVGSSAAAVWDLLASYGYRLYSISANDRSYRIAECHRRARLEYEDVLALKPAHTGLVRDCFPLPGVSESSRLSHEAGERA